MDSVWRLGLICVGPDMIIVGIAILQVVPL